MPRKADTTNTTPAPEPFRLTTAVAKAERWIMEGKSFTLTPYAPQVEELKAARTIASVAVSNNAGMSTALARLFIRRCNEQGLSVGSWTDSDGTRYVDIVLLYGSNAEPFSASCGVEWTCFESFIRSIGRLTNQQGIGLGVVYQNRIDYEYLEC